MLDSTLIVVLVGIRPHAEYQSVLRPRPLVEGLVGVLAGCRIPRGAVFGKTNANGTEVVDGQVDHGAPVSHLSASGRRRFDRII